MDEKRCAIFSRFVIWLTLAQAEECAKLSDDVCARLSLQPGIREQLDAIPPWQLKAELKSYGAWNEDDLADVWKNRRRILWLAANDIWDNRND